ncbi:MAG: hypothetical protein R3C19_26305 [Planctomycetaceae bacterium]
MSIKKLVSLLRESLRRRPRPEVPRRLRFGLMSLEDRRLPDASFALVGNAVQLDGFDPGASVEMETIAANTFQFTLTGDVWDATLLPSADFSLDVTNTILTTTTATPITGLEVGSVNNPAIVTDGALGVQVADLTIHATGDVTLNAAANDFDNVSIAGDDVVITDADDLTLDIVSANNTLTVDATGPVSDLAGSDVSATNNGSFSGSTIDLGNGMFNVGTLTFNSAGSVSIAEDSGTDIVGTNTAGSLDLTSTGAIDDSAATSIGVTSLADFDGTSISLGGGTFNAGTLTFNSAGSVTIAEDSGTDIVGSNSAGSLDLDSTGAIDDAGATDVTISGHADFNGSSISLGAGTFNADTLTFNSV